MVVGSWSWQLVEAGGVVVIKYPFQFQISISKFVKYLFQFQISISKFVKYLSVKNGGKKIIGQPPAHRQKPAQQC